MTSKPHIKRGQAYLDGIREKQENLTWPKALKNSKSADQFLWNGSPDPPLVQRVAAWLFGGTFFLIGLGLLYSTINYSFGYAPISLAFLFLGLRVFLNGFKKSKNNESTHSK